MSYYKVRSVAFKRSIKKIYVSCADPSLPPLKYYRSEYAENVEDFAEKCKMFWVDVLSGNFQFMKSNRWNSYVTDAYAEMHRIAHDIDIFGKDLDYKTSFYDELQEYVAKTYLVPIVTKEAKHIDVEFEAGFAEKCQKRWDEIDKERSQNKQIYIHTALISDIFHGWDTLWSKDKNQTIIARRGHYNNRGLLDNADETAIFLPEGSGSDWGKIAHAKTEDLPEILNKYPQLAGAITVEATYQSEERAAMDGYEKIFRKPDGVILYAKEGNHHETTWAEVIGYGEVY